MWSLCGWKTSNDYSNHSRQVELKVDMTTWQWQIVCFTFRCEKEGFTYIITVIVVASSFWSNKKCWHPSKRSLCMINLLHICNSLFSHELLTAFWNSIESELLLHRMRIYMLSKCQLDMSSWQSHRTIWNRRKPWNCRSSSHTLLHTRHITQLKGIFPSMNISHLISIHSSLGKLFSAWKNHLQDYSQVLTWSTGRISFMKLLTVDRADCKVSGEAIIALNVECHRRL